MAKDLRYYLKYDTNGKKVMAELGVSAAKLDEALGKVRKNTSATHASMLNLASATVVFDGLQSSVSALYSATKSLTDAYEVQAEAERKLETVMRQRMKATEAEIQGIKDLTSAQQQIGIIGDEVQLAGAQQLATFLSQTETLRELIPAMNDLVAQQKGYKASGTDAVSVANLMGKAMQGQASALRRVGITFTEAQQAMLENGNESERAAMLAQIITDNVGHMNAELAAMPTGKLKQFENTLGDIKESMGAFITGVMPVFTFANQTVLACTNMMKLTTAVRGTAAAISKMTIVTKAAHAISVLNVGILRRWSRGLQALGLSARGASTAIRTTSIALKGLLATTGIGLGIVALSAAIEFFTDKASEAKDKADELKDSIGGLSEVERASNEAYENTRGELSKNIALLENFKGSKEEEKKLVQQMNQLYGETMGYFNSVSDWYKTLTANSETYCRQLVIEARMRALANEAAKLEQQSSEIQKGIDEGIYDTTRKKRVVYDDKISTPLVRVPKGTEELPSELDKQLELKASIDLQKESLEKEMDKLAKEAGTLTLPVHGNTGPLGNDIRKEFDTSVSVENFTKLGQFTQKIKELNESRAHANSKKIVEIDKQIARVKELQSLFERGRYHYKIDNLPEEKRDQPEEIELPENLKDGSTISVPVEIDVSHISEPLKEMEDAVRESAEEMKRAMGDIGDGFLNAWGGLKNLNGGLSSMTEAITGNGTAWERMSGFIDGAIQSMQAVQAVTQAVTAISKAYQAIKKAETLTIKDDTNAKLQNAAAGFLQAHSWIPFVGIALGVAAVAAMAVSMASVPKYAKGGIAYGPTLGMFGEYAGAQNNPEVVAPLSDLKKYISPSNGLSGDVRFRIEGTDLVGVLERRRKFTNRI